MIKTSRQLKDLVRNRSKGNNAMAQVIIRRYIMERFLERVSMSDYNRKLIFKGGLMISSMVGLDNRSTMDIDTTVTGETLSIPEIESIIREIISIQVEDNISFEIKNISEIMDEAEYPGLRVSLEALLDNMRTPLKIDISTGDVITPHEIVYEYPLMFEKRTIPIFAYNVETILAEKLQSILARGSANTRLRDYYDLCILSDTVDINYNDLRAAFFATCKNRGTLSLIPNKDLVLSQIHSDSGMKALWESYQRKYSYAKDYAWIDVMKKLELMFNRIVSD